MVYKWITLKARETGTNLIISNKWTSQISVSHRSVTVGTINAGESLTIANVTVNDEIRIEALAVDTFNHWANVTEPLIKGVLCYATYMPATSDFTALLDDAGDNFFYCFNKSGSLLSFPTGSLDTSNITTVGTNFFKSFNESGRLISLPAGSFNFENVSTVPTGDTTILANFNDGGNLIKGIDESSGLKIKNVSNSAVNFKYKNPGGSELVTNVASGLFSDFFTTTGNDTQQIVVSPILASSNNEVTICNKWGLPIMVEYNSTEIVINSGVNVTLPLIISNPNIVVKEAFAGVFREWWGESMRPFVSGNICNIISMPTINYFTSDSGGTIAGHDFFYYFNGEVSGSYGSIASFPEGSLDTSNINTVGNNFFSGFNKSGSLTSLPDNSFNISNITTIGDNFFSEFNSAGSLTSLPADSFKFSTLLTTVGSNFFSNFNDSGSLLTLPISSFNTDNITTVGDNFFIYFCGSLGALPVNSFNTSHISTVGDGFFSYFAFFSENLLNLPIGSFSLSSSLSSVGDNFFDNFNNNGSIVSLPNNSFNTDAIVTAGDSFFNNFNSLGNLHSLPNRSFNIDNLTTVGSFCFSGFNTGSPFPDEVWGQISSLPLGSFNTDNITTVGGNFFYNFNYYGKIFKIENGASIKNITGSDLTFYYYDDVTSTSIATTVSAGESFVSYNNKGIPFYFPYKDSKEKIKNNVTAYDIPKVDEEGRNIPLIVNTLDGINLNTDNRFVDIVNKAGSLVTKEFVESYVDERSLYEGSFTYLVQSNISMAAAKSIVEGYEAAENDTAIIFYANSDIEFQAGNLAKGLYAYNTAVPPVLEWAWVDIPANQVTNGSWILIGSNSVKWVLKIDGFNPIIFQSVGSSIDSNVVFLDTNQTIAGTKTFTTSPVVPNKNSSVIDDGTAIATEAQVKKLEDGLPLLYVSMSGDQTVNGIKTFNASPVVPNKTIDATNDGTIIATEAQVYKVDQKILPLYTTTGINEDAAMTQKATTTALNDLSAKNPSNIITSPDANTTLLAINNNKIALSVLSAYLKSYLGYTGESLDTQLTQLTELVPLKNTKEQASFSLPAGSYLKIATVAAPLVGGVIVPSISVGYSIDGTFMVTDGSNGFVHIGNSWDLKQVSIGQQSNFTFGVSYLSITSESVELYLHNNSQSSITIIPGFRAILHKNSDTIISYTTNYQQSDVSATTPSNYHQATTSTLGGNTYVLPQATTSTLGGIIASEKTEAETEEVKIETATGKIFSKPGTAFVLPQATSNALGGVKADERTTENIEAKIDTTTGKLYVNSSIEDVVDFTGYNIQDNVGKIYRYTGVTDANYTNGKFYRVESQTVTTPATAVFSGAPVVVVENAEELNNHLNGQTSITEGCQYRAGVSGVGIYDYFGSRIVTIYSPFYGVTCIDSPDHYGATGTFTATPATTTTSYNLVLYPFGLTSAADTTDEKDSQCEDAAITPKALARVNDYRISSTTYGTDDIVACQYHAELLLKCKTAGTTSSSILDTSGVIADQDEITDGTVVWVAEKIDGKENVINKVTSLSSSSTDTEYPSAKAVYDLIGDIETLLSNI